MPIFPLNLPIDLGADFTFTTVPWTNPTTGAINSLVGYGVRFNAYADPKDAAPYLALTPSGSVNGSAVQNGAAGTSTVTITHTGTGILPGVRGPLNFDWFVDAPLVVTGSTNVTTGGLYGAGGTLNGLTLILTVNGGAQLTLALSGSGNTANQAALLAAIAAQWPALGATVNATNNLALADSLTGPTASVVVGAGTANALLGLTPGTTLSFETLLAQGQILPNRTMGN